MTYTINKIKSFDNVLDTLVSVCRDHPLVNQAEHGDPWEINPAGNAVYPLCLVVPTSINALDKQVQYNFNILCMDLVEPGEGIQEKRVQSATASILLDIIGWFKRGGRYYDGTNDDYENTREYYDYTNEISTTFTLEPFTEKFTDNVSGWNMQFSITMYHDYSVCSWDGVSLSDVSISGSGDITAATLTTSGGPNVE